MKKRSRQPSSKKNAKNKKEDNPPISQLTIIDIYQRLLKNKSLNDTLSQLQSLMEEDRDSDEHSLHMTIINLLFKLSGISVEPSEINFRSVGRSVQSIFQRLYQQPEALEKMQGELPLIQKSNSAHKRCMSNLIEFWELLFSQKTQILKETKMLQWLVELLVLFSNNKIRVIRSVAGELLNILVKQAIHEYRKSSSRQLKKFIYDIYNQILKQRIKEVDLHIRQKLLTTISLILTQLSKQFLTQMELNLVFSAPLADKSTDNQLLVIGCIQKLYCCQVQHPAPLIAFGNSLIQPLVARLQDNPKLISPSVNLLSTLKSYSQQIELSDTIVIELFCKAISSKQGLKDVAQLFFKQIFPQYAKKSDKQVLKHLSGKIFIGRIVRKVPQLPTSVRDSFFTALVQFSKGLFDIDQMFLILISQKAQTTLQEFQIQNMLSLIRAYISVISKDKPSEQRDNIIVIYQKRVLVYCKQIFFDKITKLPSLTYDYVRLFGMLSLPVPASFEAYLEIVQKQLTILFGKVSSKELLQQIVNIIKKVRKSGVRDLIQQINIEEAVTLTQPIPIFRCNALLSQFKVSQILQPSIVNQLTSNFFHATDMQILTSALSIMHHGHLWLFRDVTMQSTEQAFRTYIEFREIFVHFLTKALSHPIEKCKRAVFSVVCQALSLISNNKFLQTPIILYQPTETLVDQIFRCVQSFEDTLRINWQQKTIQNQQIEPEIEQLLNTLTTVCSKSIRFCIIPKTTDFLISMLKSFNKKIQQITNRLLSDLVSSEGHKDNQNRFIFWRVAKQLLLKCQNVTRIADRLLGQYFGKKTSSKTYSKTLLNKLILFIVETIEQGFADSKQRFFQILLPLVKKIVRRCQKSTLSKINAIFLSKHSGSNDEFRRSSQVRAVKSLLAKYTQQKDNTQKMEEDGSGQESSLDKRSVRSMRSDKNSRNQSQGSDKEENESNMANRLRSKSKRKSSRGARNV